MSTVTGNPAEPLARARLNLETAQISWRELQPYFARGATLMVSQDLDLVEVAAQISADNAARVAAWMEAGRITRGRIDFTPRGLTLVGARQRSRQGPERQGSPSRCLFRGQECKGSVAGSWTRPERLSPGQR